MELFKEFIRKININISIKELNSLMIYLTISILIYLLIPNKIINDISNKLFDNKFLNIIVIIITIYGLLILLKKCYSLISKYLIHQMDKYKEFEKLYNIIDLLDVECFDILYKFYNNGSFKIATKLLTTEPGIEYLEKMDIIEYKGSIDEEGGRPITNQLYVINEKFLNVLNSKKIKKSKNNLKKYILLLDSI